eukprot:c15900_g1_i1 orf=414-1790(-)
MRKPNPNPNLNSYSCLLAMATFLKQSGRSMQALITVKYPWLHQLRRMSIPRIRSKPDRALDEVTERDKVLRPFFRIVDIITCEETLAMKVRRLENMRWDLAIKNKKLNVVAFMKRYPNIFIVYTNPNDRKPWCKLTPEFMALVDEERKICRDMELCNVETLRRLLMMAAFGRIRVDKLQSVRRIFGFTDDFLDRLVPQYPQFFKITRSGKHGYVELVEWDEGLAVSEFEKKAKQEALNKGLGDIEVKGKPFPFKIFLSPGMALRKKNLEVLASWQKLPYISPYEDWTLVQKGTPLSEKRLVALLHEFLSLTIEKKARLKVIQPFRDEYGLSQKIIHVFERFPGIFYTSLRGGIKTIMLREGYKGSDLVEDHPLVHLKEKYVEMVHAGPRLRGRKEMDGSTDGESMDETDDAELSQNEFESSDGELMDESADAKEYLENESSDMDDCDHSGNEEERQNS